MSEVVPHRIAAMYDYAYWCTGTLALVLFRDVQCLAWRMPTIIGHSHGVAVCSALRFRVENGTVPSSISYLIDYCRVRTSILLFNTAVRVYLYLIECLQRVFCWVNS